MRWLVCALLVLAGCDSFKDIPCDQCAKYGAVCNPVTQTCQRGLVLDMAVPVMEDMAKPVMLPDLAMPDGPLPPMCTPSTATADCTDVTKPVCGAGGMCRACTSGDDAVCLAHSVATPHCATSGPSAGQCVACTTATQATDCPASTPICGSDNICRTCQAHAECPSLGTWMGGAAIPGICVLDSGTGLSQGACVPATPAQLAFVDNLGGPIGGCKGNHMTHDGTTPAKAYCDVQDAVMGAAPYVVVRGYGTANSYGIGGGNPVAITRSITIVGPGGKGVASPAVLETLNGNPDINVTGTATVVLDGLELTSSNGNGITCSNGVAGSKVIGRRLNVHTVSQIGVSSSGCELVLDGNYIEGNVTGGVVLTSTKSVLTNNIISGTQNGYGISISTVQAGSIFAFNSVVGNNVGNGTGGIACVSTSVIQASIVYGNGSTAGTQFLGTCTLQNVVTGTDSAANAIQQTPAFTTDSHLDTADATNQMYLIDQLTAPGTPNSDHDVDFTPRPKGTGPKNYDIGAEEAE